MSKVRIATVNATGCKYIIQQIEFSKTPKVHCWGEVCRTEGSRTSHEASKSFLKSEVTITEVDKTPVLVASLFQQNVRLRREAGHVLTGRRTVVDHGKPSARV